MTDTPATVLVADLADAAAVEAVADQLPAELLESSAAAAFVSKDELGSVDLRTFFLRPEGK